MSTPPAQRRDPDHQLCEEEPPASFVRQRDGNAKRDTERPLQSLRFPARRFHHDSLVGQLALELMVGYPHALVHVNSGSAKLFAVRGLYPDIVAVFGVGATARYHLYELETWDQVSWDGAQRWIDLASLGHPFTMVVPEHSRPDAIELLFGLGLHHVDILTYHLTDTGKPVFG